MLTRTRRMLVADDSRPCRLAFCEAAGRATVPIRVIEACDGRECWDQLKHGTIDLAFIDVHMPQTSGLEALWEARNLAPRTFVTLVSCSMTERFIELAQKLRAHEFLLKPFGEREVDGIIKRYQRLSVPIRVLVVDDSGTVRKIIEKVLTASFFRIEFVEAPDGTTALACCESSDFDFVFLDCDMPGLNGFETLDRLVARDPHIKVVMISGEWSERPERDALERGAKAFLRKPFFPSDIDALFHAAYAWRLPNLIREGTGLAREFGVEIVGRKISITHNPTGHRYEYLWFRESPYLRLGQVTDNGAAGRFFRHIRADAEKVAMLELTDTNLVNVVASPASNPPLVTQHARGAYRSSTCQASQFSRQ